MKYKLLLYNLLIVWWILLESFTGFTNPDTTSKENLNYKNNIRILTNLADKVYSENPEKGLQYAQYALELVQKKGDKENEEKILSIIGKIYKRADYDRLAIPFYNRAITLAEEMKNSGRIAENSLLLGDIYYKLNYTDSSTVYYNKSLSIYSSLNNKLGIANATIRVGNTFWFSAGYDKALEYYLKALSIYEEINNKRGIAEVNTNVGSLYSLLGDYKNALKYFRKAMSYIDKFEDPEHISNLYYRYGTVFENLKRFDSAFVYYKSASSILDSMHLEQKSGYIDQSIGNIYFEQGKFDQAISYAKKALDKFESHDNRFGIASVYNNLATYYLKLEEYSTSLKYLEKGLKLTKEIKSVELLKSYYLTLSQYYKDKESFQKALHYHELYQQMNDSVTNREKNLRIAELQTKYETNKNIQELAAKTEENNRNIEQIRKQRRNLYLFGTGIILILLMSLGLYWQYKLLRVREIKIKEINKELDGRVKERTAALQLTQFSIEHAADPIFWLDKNGNFIFANYAASYYMEFSKEDFLNKNISSIIPKFTISEWQDIWEIIKNEGSLVMELFFQKKNQQLFPVEITLNYISHEGNEYAFAFIKDISDRKSKEENLRTAKEKAEEADKLKSAFLANMSHEIRTPMNAILGFSELLIGEPITQDEKKEFAGIIKSSADTLLKLIDDIIDISLIDAGQMKMNPTQFELNAILKEIIRFYQEEKIRLQKSHLDIRLAGDVYNNQVILYADPVRFRQIVTNLVGNAMKFTEKGFIELGFTLNHDHVSIYVKDTGIGIHKDKIPLVFERFRKHNDKNKLYGGTGLGLAISKKMVEQMGGTIEATSEIGNGSVFSFSLPFESKSGPILNFELPEESRDELFWENKKILIVEDVESNYLYLEKILKNTEITIYWAKDGNEAIELCRLHEPDIILMDIQLPAMDGYQVTREIKNLYPQTPVIAQTAYAFSNEKENFKLAGFSDYITKPIDSDILLKSLKKHLR
jgi:PAS domain S-box-containing protein